MIRSSDFDVTEITAAHVWYRHVPVGTSPFGRPYPARVRSARWQRNEVVAALYLADSEETMWSEWRRRVADPLTGSETYPDDSVPRDVYAFRFELSGVAHLASRARIRRVGLPYPPRPNDDSWQACQEVGHALFHLGAPALLAVSAPLLRGRVLCVFRPAQPTRGGDVTYPVPGIVDVKKLRTQERVPPEVKGARQ